MNDDLEKLDGEIARLQREASAVQRLGPTFDEAWPAAERALVEAEQIFRQHGPQISGVQSMLPEHIHQRQQAIIGAAVVANKKALLDSERARIKAQTEGGIASPDKARRLDQLRAAVLQAAARRELLVRATEGEGEFKPRPPLHAELTVFRRAALEELAR